MGALGKTFRLPLFGLHGAHDARRESVFGMRKGAGGDKVEALSRRLDDLANETSSNFATMLWTQSAMRLELQEFRGEVLERNKRVDQQFGAVREQIAGVHGQLKDVEIRIGGVNHRLGRLESGLTDVRDSMAILHEGQARNEERFRALEAGQVRSEDRLGRLEEGQTKLEKAQVRTETRLEKVEGGLNKVLEILQARLPDPGLS